MMRVITVREPHATLAALGVKRIETRPWATNYRGGVLIHSASRPLDRAARELLVELANKLSPDSADAAYSRLTAWTSFIERSRGKIIAYAIADDCEKVEAIEKAGLTDLERSLGDYSPGRYGITLSHPIFLPSPIPYKGQQQRGLLKIGSDIQQEVKKQIDPNYRKRNRRKAG